MDGLRNKQEEERAGACGEGSGREDQDNTSLRVVLRNTGEASRRMEQRKVSKADDSLSVGEHEEGLAQRTESLPCCVLWNHLRGRPWLPPSGSQGAASSSDFQSCLS